MEYHNQNKRKKMKQREIEGIFKKRFEKINIAFDSVRLHFIENDIRIFRVKVKKLQACLRLMDAAKGHPHSLQLPQKIVKLYKISGAIRTLQMQQSHVRNTLNEGQIVLPEVYLALMSNKILHHIETATKLISGSRPFEKSEIKLLHLLPHHFSPKTIGKFIASEEGILEKLLSPVFLTDKSFHAIRRLLKNLLYLFPYIETDISALSAYALLSNLENIDSFTKILGSFHDLNTAIACLHTECLNIEINENEKIVLRNIESTWIKERAAVHEKIYDQIHKIIASRRSAKFLAKWPVM